MRIKNRRLLGITRVFVVIWMTLCVACVYFIDHNDGVADTIVTSHVHDYKNDLHDRCPNTNTLTGTLKENIAKLERNNYSKSQHWIEHTGLYRTPPHVMTSFPVFVTAANPLYFIKSQTLVRTFIDRVIKYNRDAKLIYYSLGLSPGQKDIITRNCKSCELREFHFNLFPEHVKDLQTYAFKPIIVKMTYQEFGHVWWVDASARFISTDFLLPVKYLREYGLLFFTYDKTYNVALHTHRKMFKYLNEDPCLYKNLGEIEAGNIAFRKSHVAEVVLRHWLSCALDVDCIAPQNATKKCGKHLNGMRDEMIGRCHRFDQSALSIIIRRLYHKQNDYPIIVEPFKLIEIHRKGQIQFFT